MKRPFTLVLVLILLICSNRAVSQNDLRFKRIFGPEGEPITGIQYVLHDSEGYVWLAAHGLNLLRLDGRNRRAYSPNDLNAPNSNTANGSFVFEDSRKNIWLATDGGAFMRYNRSIDKFELVNDSASNIVNRVASFAETDDGSFWLGTLGGGLVHFNPVSKKLTRYLANRDDASTLSDNYVTGLVFADNKLWIATTGGLCSYEPATDKFTRHLLTNSNPQDTYRFRVLRDLLLVDNKLFLCTYGGLQIFDIRTQQSKHLVNNPEDPTSLPHNSLFRAVKDPDGSLWIASYGGGLIRFDPATRKFNSWKNDPYDDISISTDNLFGVYLDRQGVLWILTADNTLCLFDTNAKKFHWMIHKPSREEGISKGWIYSILQENDSIFWLGFNGNGLNQVNVNTGVARKFVNNPNDKNSLGNNVIASIGFDRQKRLWVGTGGGGVNMYDPKTGRFTRYEAGGTNSINNNAVSAMLVDNDDRIWITTFRDGLNIYDIGTRRFKRVSEDSLKKTNNVSLAFTDRIFKWEDHIVFKTQQQVVLYDKTRNRFVKLAEAAEAAAGTMYPAMEVNPLSETELLLVTKSEIKIVRYNDPDHVESKVVMQLDPEVNDICSFVVDHDRKVWYITSFHLANLDLQTRESKRYSTPDGILLGDLFSLYPDRQGRIFLSSIAGLNWFHPDEIDDDTVRRNIRFTDFKLYNRSMEIGRPDSLTGFSLDSHISVLPRIQLKHDQSFFSIEFSAMEFIAPGNISYAYKLDGFDKSWVQVGNQNFASYTNLDPGYYTFHVKCANPDGFWGDPISVSIVIHPPFWRTWWFVALVVSVIAVIAYYVHNYRLAQSLKIERLRNKIAGDLHDEVGSSLTRVSIYSDMLRNESNDAERQDYLGRISTLSREVVGTMSDIVWSIDSQSDSLEALLLRMKDFATELLHSKNIQVNFRTTGLKEQATIDPVVRQNIYLIFKEAINNVVKHASADEMTVDIHNDQGEFRMTISDNGRGFDTKSHGQGHGLRSMNRRGLAAGGTVTIRSETKGTTVTFTRKPL